MYLQVSSFLTNRTFKASFPTALQQSCIRFRLLLFPTVPG